MIAIGRCSRITESRSSCARSEQSAAQPVEQLCETRSVQDKRTGKMCFASNVHHAEQPALHCLRPFPSSAIERGGLRRGHVSLISLGSKPTSHCPMMRHVSFHFLFSLVSRRSLRSCLAKIAMWVGINFSFSLVLSNDLSYPGNNTKFSHGVTGNISCMKTFGLRRSSMT